jgi:hypothetical protein
MRVMVKIVLVVVGLAQLLTGLLAFVAPGAFYDALAGYPPENHHFITDLGSWQIALGAAALYAATRADWHVPMLGILALQYALHAISHVVDVNDSDPAWQGPFALTTQLIGFVVLGALFLRERAR